MTPTPENGRLILRPVAGGYGDRRFFQKRLHYVKASWSLGDDGESRLDKPGSFTVSFRAFADRRRKARLKTQVLQNIDL